MTAPVKSSPPSTALKLQDIMIITLFSPEALVTGGVRVQQRATDNLQLDFWQTFDDEQDTGYCLDAPWVMPAGSTANHYDTPGCSVVYRKLMNS